MNANGRPPAEIQRYTLFKIGVLLLLLFAIGLTQWSTEGVEPSRSFVIPTPVPTSVPTEEIVLEAPSLLVGSPTPFIVNRSLILHGSGTPDHVISLRRDGVEQGKAVVDEYGNWSFESDLDAVGQFTWTAVAIDGAGRTSPASQPHLLEVVEPSAPTLMLPKLADDFTGGDVRLTGSADPASIVSILLNDRIYDVATADENGEWSYTLPLTETGRHTIAAQLIDATVDEVLSSESVEIEVVE